MSYNRRRMHHSPLSNVALLVLAVVTLSSSTGALFPNGRIVRITSVYPALTFRRAGPDPIDISNFVLCGDLGCQLLSNGTTTALYGVYGSLQLQGDGDEVMINIRVNNATTPRNFANTSTPAFFALFADNQTSSATSMVDYVQIGSATPASVFYEALAVEAELWTNGTFAPYRDPLGFRGNPAVDFGPAFFCSDAGSASYVAISDVAQNIYGLEEGDIMNISLSSRATDRFPTATTAWDNAVRYGTKYTGTVLNATFSSTGFWFTSKVPPQSVTDNSATNGGVVRLFWRSCGLWWSSSRSSGTPLYMSYLGNVSMNQTVASFGLPSGVFQVFKVDKTNLPPYFYAAQIIPGVSIVQTSGNYITSPPKAWDFELATVVSLLGSWDSSLAWCLNSKFNASRNFYIVLSLGARNRNGTATLKETCSCYSVTPSGVFGGVYKYFDIDLPFTQSMPFPGVGFNRSTVDITCDWVFGGTVKASNLTLSSMDCPLPVAAYVGPNDGAAMQNIVSVDPPSCSPGFGSSGSATAVIVKPVILLSGIPFLEVYGFKQIRFLRFQNTNTAFTTCYEVVASELNPNYTGVFKIGFTNNFASMDGNNAASASKYYSNCGICMSPNAYLYIQVYHLDDISAVLPISVTIRPSRTYPPDPPPYSLSTNTCGTVTTSVSDCSSKPECFACADTNGNLLSCSPKLSGNTLVCPGYLTETCSDLNARSVNSSICPVIECRDPSPTPDCSAYPDRGDTVKSCASCSSYSNVFDCVSDFACFACIATTDPTSRFSCKSKPRTIANSDAVESCNDVYSKFVINTAKTCSSITCRGWLPGIPIPTLIKTPSVSPSNFVLPPPPGPSSSSQPTSAILPTSTQTSATTPENPTSGIPSSPATPPQTSTTSPENPTSSVEPTTTQTSTTSPAAPTPATSSTDFLTPSINPIVPNDSPSNPLNPIGPASGSFQLFPLVGLVAVLTTLSLL